MITQSDSLIVRVSQRIDTFFNIYVCLLHRLNPCRQSMRAEREREVVGVETERWAGIT